MNQVHVLKELLTSLFCGSDVSLLGRESCERFGKSAFITHSGLHEVAV